MSAWLMAGATVATAGAGLVVTVRGDPRRHRLLPAPSGGRRPVSRPWVAAGGAAIGALLAPAGGWVVPLGLVCGAAAWVLPSFTGARRRRGERAAADALVPDLIDLVALGVGAGLTAHRALERAVVAVGDPLRSSLEPARRRVALGGSWHTSIGAAAADLSSDGLARLARALERAQRLGSEARASLLGAASDARGRARSVREERARRAPVVLLFPLVLCILPAFVLAAVVPAMVVALRGFG